MYSFQKPRSLTSLIANFQCLSGAVESAQEARLLLVAGDVQEELENHGAVARQVSLVLDDRLHALLPQAVRVQMGEVLLLQYLGVDPDHEDLLVVAAVEDADAAPLGQAAGGAPQEIVIQLLARRLLEVEHLAARRIDAGKQGVDRAVLAGGVHGLEDQQQRMAVLRVEQPLLAADVAHGAAPQFAELVVSRGIRRRPAVRHCRGSKRFVPSGTR